MQQNLTIDGATLHFKYSKIVAFLSHGISINETDGIQIGNRHNINKNKESRNVTTKFKEKIDRLNFQFNIEFKYKDLEETKSSNWHQRCTSKPEVSTY